MRAVIGFLIGKYLFLTKSKFRFSNVHRHEETIVYAFRDTVIKELREQIDTNMTMIDFATFVKGAASVWSTVNGVYNA